MELSGTHTIKAPQALVWKVLTDPETLRRTLPGCQRFDSQEDGSYNITMSIGIAAIKGTYTGTVRLLNEKPPDSYSLKVSAKGGVGFIDGQGDFVLTPAEDNGDHTKLSYTGQAQVGGKIAGVGQRLLQGGANLVIGQFFRALDKEVAQSEGNMAQGDGS
ncbi:MAG: carbon monoxide dehydrogenase subunit G [Chloroflexota bacterium]|nr:carbon monoxide dehydrogenase subunit G [Chloroflexota bacterium]